MTRRRPFAVIAALLGLALAGQALAQTPSTFTYQGRLDFQDMPYTGTADYRFSVYDSPTGGVQVGTTQALPAIVVEDGLFSALIDLGVEVHAPGNHLQIEVRTPAWDGQGAEPPYFMFHDRVPITASPYAIHTRGLFVSDDASHVGIGVATPTAALHVRRPVGATEVARFADQNDLSQVRINATTFRGEIQGWNGSAGAPGILALNPAGGFVGVNTSAPATWLDVNGGILARGGLPASGTASNGYAFRSDFDTGLFSVATNAASIFTGGVEAFRFTQTGLRFPDGTIQTTSAQGAVLIRDVALGTITIAGNATTQVSLSVSGVNSLMGVAINPPGDLPPSVSIDFVRTTSTGQVRFRLRNHGSGSQTISPATWRFTLFP